MIQRRLSWFVCIAVSIAATALSMPQSAKAHPHVFVDGSVDFVVDDRGALSELSITWRYDPFETLYVLTSIGIVPAPDGTLSAGDRKALIRNESNWPEDFDGAAKLTIEGASVPLSRPKALDARLEDGRLIVQFRRELDTPAMLQRRNVEVLFYERTYYYAFSVATEPQIIGVGDSCEIGVNPFNASKQHEELQTMLAALGREETPEDTNVGALFADRIVLTCA